MATNDQQLLEQQYDETVRADIEQFRERSQAWVNKEITDDQFRAQRLRRGVYGQRQEGVHMIRTKIPGGLLTSDQMRKMGDVADAVAINKFERRGAEDALRDVRRQIARNREVDARTYIQLQKAGWRQGVVWECALKGRERLPFDEVIACCSTWLRSDSPELDIRGQSGKAAKAK